MKVNSVKLAMPLLGVLLWVLSIHAGIFSDPSTQYILVPPSDGHLESNTFKTIYTSKVKKVLETVTRKDLNSSVNFAATDVGYMKTLENNLKWANIKVGDGTPSHGMLISFKPDNEAIHRERDALVALRATNQLMNMFCPKLSEAVSPPLSDQECARMLSKFTFHHTPLAQVCEMQESSCDSTQRQSPYRTINGSCNNLVKAHKGESFTGYSRILHAYYSDGVHRYRRSVTKKPLPNPRLIVNSLVRHGDQPSSKATMALMQWTQFIEHDLAKTATSVAVHTRTPIECCSADGYSLSPRFVHPFCAPIDVSHDKKYSDKFISCLNFVRSIPAVRSDCSFGAAEQVNQATHYLDGSQIYGSTLKKSEDLRTFQDGELKVSTYNGRTYLPLSNDPSNDCSKSSTCFQSGDSRVNFQPQLTLMYTLWHREHNRIAKELSKLNENWDDEKIFQEARRIVVSEMQHITYDEWLPAVLGKSEHLKILSGTYHPKSNAAVSNAFATAVLRSFKSLADGTPKLYDENRNVSESIVMRGHFHNPEILTRDGALDSLARGLATQPSQNLDIYYAEDLIDHLYANQDYGFDVLTFDIQRGRDHGLPGYNDYRAYCGLRRAKSFSDFEDVITDEDISTLSGVYASPKDVDLIIGGLLEKPEEDALVGPTFACILSNQMTRSREGDRYFFDNPDQPKPFTHSQLDQIKKTTLARIMCDNGDDIQRMQKRVFEKVGPSNPLFKCDSEDIPKMDLSFWQEL